MSSTDVATRPVETPPAKTGDTRRTVFPFISVIVPTYNRARVLPYLFQALAYQQYPADRMELIVVDNSSSDDTEAVVGRWADVLPFAVNRLPAATRAHVALAAVMGMSDHALFEFHLSSWISDSKSGPATLPEITRISGVPVLCIYGADESDSLCPQLDPKKFIIVRLKGGHHFDGDYANLARHILAAANP